MKTFIIAEAGVNHNGSLEMAKKLIDVAVESGADVVKFQTFRADALVTESAPKAQYQIEQTSDAGSQHGMLKALELSVEQHIELIKHAKMRGIMFLSTPFDLESATLLSEQFNLPMMKVASGEITNSPLLLQMARTGKPIILSTGMSTISDIDMALSVIAYGYLHADKSHPTSEGLVNAFRSDEGQALLRKNVTLLHCTTDYPVKLPEVNLKAMDTMRQAFNLPVGYSDHTRGIEIAIAAVARGAVMIEKHFTLDHTLSGPDHAASLEPQELKAMISAIRNVEVALGNGLKIPTTSEYPNRAIARKSLVALQPIKVGEKFNETNLGLKRPGSGISGIFYWNWLGKKALRDFSQNELIDEATKETERSPSPMSV